MNKNLSLKLISLLMVFGSVQVANSKKLTYLGHEYNGKVNSQNIPEGKGKIDIGGLIIEGMFDGKTINDATFKTEWLRYDGNVVFGREDNISLKQGGVLTKYYYQIQDIRVERIMNRWTIYENSLPGKLKSYEEKLSQDKEISYEGLKKEPLRIPFKFNMTGVPFELNPPVVNKMGEFPLANFAIWRSVGRQEGDMLAYVANTMPEANTFVQNYKDDEGRIWTYIEAFEDGVKEMRFFVTYPNGSQYNNEGSWKLVYPDGVVNYTNSNLQHLQLIVVDDEIAIKNFGCNTELNDFLRYQSGQAKIPLTSGVAIIIPQGKRDISVSEMENLLKEKVFSLFQIKAPFAAKIYAMDGATEQKNYQYDSKDYYLGRYDNGRYIPEPNK